MISPYLSFLRLISRIFSRFLLVALVVMALPFTPVSADPLRAGEAFSLTGMLLVAEDDMRDPRFAHSVLLIARHDSNGAFGLMINHPTKILLSRALPDMEELEHSREKLFIGGPMTGAPYMLLISSAERMPDNSAQLVFDDVYFSMNTDLIPRMMKQPKRAFRVYSGYASWAPGQLEGELERGGWHLESADTFTIFQKASSRVWSDLSNSRGSLKWINLECEIDNCSALDDAQLVNAVNFQH